MDTESSSLFKTISISFALSVAFGLIIGHAKAQLNANDMSRLTNESKQGSTEQVFVSAKKQTQLIELYSSQGCSSCPPAERWVNELSNNEGLWLNFIPMVFHVDYWNYIGWADPYASSENSQRQRQFRDIGAIYDLPQTDISAENQALVVWLTEQDKLTPIQAVGGPIVNF